MSEAPTPVRSDLREVYELLRSRRRAAGRHVYALLVTRGMAEWIRAAAELLPAMESAKRSRPVGAGIGRAERDELAPGVVPDLVPILTGLILDSMRGGAS